MLTYLLSLVDTSIAVCRIVFTCIAFTCIALSDHIAKIFLFQKAAFIFEPIFEPKSKGIQALRNVEDISQDYSAAQVSI